MEWEFKLEEKYLFDIVIFENLPNFCIVEEAFKNAWSLLKKTGCVFLNNPFTYITFPNDSFQALCELNDQQQRRIKCNDKSWKQVNGVKNGWTNEQFYWWGVFYQEPICLPLPNEYVKQIGRGSVYEPTVRSWIFSNWVGLGNYLKAKCKIISSRDIELFNHESLEIIWPRRTKNGELYIRIFKV
jgi:hypothetical protein